MVLGLFAQKVIVHREYYSRELIAGTYTLPNLVKIVIWAMIIALPLHIMLQNESKYFPASNLIGMLFTSYSAYQEQPAFKYTGDMYAEVVMANAGGEETKYEYATTEAVSNTLENPIFPTLSMVPVYNDDGKIDQYTVNMRFRKKEAGTAISKITVLMGLEAELSKVFRANVQGIAYAEVETLASDKLSAGEIRLIGNMALRDTPYRINRNKAVTELGESVFTLLPDKDLVEVTNNYFLQSTGEHDTLLEYNIKSKQVLYAPISQDYFDVKMTVQFPTDTIDYVPQFWSQLKYAWVRYFAVFILFYYILHKYFLNTLMTQGAFETFTVSDLNLSGME